MNNSNTVTKKEEILQKEILHNEDGSISKNEVETFASNIIPFTKKEPLQNLENEIELSYSNSIIKFENKKHSKQITENQFELSPISNSNLFYQRLWKALVKLTNHLLICLKKENLKLTIKSFKKLGFKQFIWSLKNGYLDFIRDDKETNQRLYLNWIEKSEPNSSELDLQKRTSASLKYSPSFSLITIIDGFSPKLLNKTIESVCKQTYPNWELWLVILDENPIIDEYVNKDSRLKVKLLKRDSSFADNINETIKSAKGEFIAFLNQNDELAPNALFENALLLNQSPQADMIYSDEDKINLEGLRYDPHFKPNWSPDLFYSMMYTSQLGVYRRSLINEIGGFKEGFEGAENYDLVLRLIERTNQIYHLPKVLCHQHNSENFNNNPAKIKALSEYFKRLDITTEVTSGLTKNLLRVKRKFSVQPKVSIIIPTHNRADLLKKCLDSIQKHTIYNNYEIIVVDNNSYENETLDYLTEISANTQIRVIKYPHPFDFSAINNFAANQADGELLLFLNNDTEVISNEWLEAMIEHTVRPEIGAVGARLLYPNNTVQHAGVILGIGGIADHSHKHFSDQHSGYFGRAKAIQNVSAVTGACLMVRKSIFTELGGFNEKDLAIAYNDIDFCLRIRQKGLLNIYTPYAELYHYESLSRGYEKTSEKALRFQREREYMLKNWKEILQSDPYYNPNLTLEKEDFSIMDMTEK